MNTLPEKKYSIVIEEHLFSIDVWIDNKYKKELEKIPGIAFVVKDALYDNKYFIKIDERYEKEDVFEAIANIDAGEPRIVRLVRYL